MLQPIRHKPKMIPPDGGWGWVVVLGAALTNSFNQSLLSIYGLIFGEKLIEMGENTVGAALVGNVMLVMTNFIGLITGPVLKKYSPRQVSIVASILSAIGMIGASFATETWHLIATYSVFTGAGIGLLQPATFMAVNSYFTKKRGQAVGVSMAGTGIGQMLMPHLVRYLLDSFGFKGTALTLGGLALNGVVGSALFHPVEWHLVPEKEEHQPLLSRSNSNDDSNEHQTMEDKEVESYFNQPPHEEIGEDCSKQSSYSSCAILSPSKSVIGRACTPIPKSEGFFSKIKKFFNLELLMDCTFINVIFGLSLAFTSNQNFNMLFPFFLQQQVGLSRPDTAMCMSSLAAADIVARLTIPIATDKYNISSRTSFFVTCIVLTGARMVLTAQNEYVGLLVASAMNGFSRSMIIVNQNFLVSDHLPEGDPKLPSALGLAMIMRGVSVITIGQLLGWVRDYTNSYIICIYAQNLLLVMVAVMWTFEWSIKKCCLQKR